MTVQHAIRIFEAEQIDCPPALHLLLLTLAYRADRRGVIRHSQVEIAGHLSLTRRTVALHVAALVEAGLLAQERRGRYRLELSAWAEETTDDALSLTDGVRWAADAVRLAKHPKPVKDRQGNVRTPADAKAEEQRLRAERRPGQGIAYTAAGWPVLMDS